ncbi:hypothetical protein LTR09_005608 [Extremus antarcticus]|uniref:XPG-I domain-containing protein n=1 Tax=Extremus antarcticus TaxID=702011 RepID=A0AAJ0DG95_9PEZI|nr:hypothetical protein LTR09_005608 [Extremus antarcticus]
MGIPGLWDILGDGEVKSIAELSTEHLKRTGRPLRVAIDEAGWRFNNLTDQQVAAIRAKEPRANPIERTILWRLFRLMRMNIQPIFIFDGPSRPWKRGGVAGRIDWKKIDLLRKTFDQLKIPHHRAPAEAEAECARLNQLGIVDAVWSDDGDTLMFGANVLIRDYREGGGKSGKKSDSHVRVYRAEAIVRDFGIDRQGLILFALLNGGDYDSKGLEGCGPKAALAAAQFDNGRLSRILCETPLRQLQIFTEYLREYFQKSSKQNVFVPVGYPRDLHVKNYREPKVSSAEDAHNLRGLSKGWEMPIHEEKLRTFLLERFNFQTREYIKHIVPVLLTRTLTNTEPEGVQKNADFRIELVTKRGQDPHAPVTEREITFSPLGATALDLIKQPANEDWSTYTKKDGVLFDPEQPVEAELLECVLEKGLRSVELQRLKEFACQPKPRKRKRKAKDAVGDPASSATVAGEALPVAPKKATKKPRMEVEDAQIVKPVTKKKRKTKKEKEQEAAAAAAATADPPSTFRLPTVLERYGSWLDVAEASSFQSSSRSSQNEHIPLPLVDIATSSRQDVAPQPRTSDSRHRAHPSEQARPSSSLPAPSSAFSAGSVPQVVKSSSQGRDEHTMLPTKSSTPTVSAHSDRTSSPVLPAVRSSPLIKDGERSRQEIAAARLRHFEKAAEPTFDAFSRTKTTLKHTRPTEDIVTTATPRKPMREVVDLTLDD